jgi:Rieske Fe-S protein
MSRLPNYPSTDASCGGCKHPTGLDTEPVLEVVDRRTAIGNGVLTAVAALLATPLVNACATGGASGAAASSRTTSLDNAVGRWMMRVRVADFPALAAPDGYARIDNDSDMPVAVVRTERGYAAFSLVCPHAGGTVELVGGKFQCPVHGAQYSKDGTWVGGHRAKNLHALSVTEDNGVLTIVV